MNAEIKELEEQLKTAVDIKRIDLLNRLGWRYRGHDLDKALSLVTEASSLARQMEYDEGLIESLRLASWVMQVKGSYGAGLKYALEEMSLARQSGKPKHIVYAHGNAGMCYGYLGDYATALELLFEVLEMTNSLDDKEMRGYVLGCIFLIYDLRSEYEQALVYGEEALTIHEKTGSLLNRIVVLHNCAGALSQLGRHEKSTAYNLKAIELATASGQYAEMLWGLRSALADSYRHLGEYEKSRTIFQEILSAPSNHALLSSLIGLGELYITIGASWKKHRIHLSWR